MLTILLKFLRKVGSKEATKMKTKQKGENMINGRCDDRLVATLKLIELLSNYTT